MYFVYILKSEKNNTYYTGQTIDITTRITLHNAGKVSSTKINCPYKLIYKEEFIDRSSAVKRERQIKSWKSRKAIEKLIENRGSSIRQVGSGHLQHSKNCKCREMPESIKEEIKKRGI